MIEMTGDPRGLPALIPDDGAPLTLRSAVPLGPRHGDVALTSPRRASSHQRPLRFAPQGVKCPSEPRAVLRGAARWRPVWRVNRRGPAAPMHA